MDKKVIATIQEEGCCTPLYPPAIRGQEAEEAAQLFAALGDPTRLSILSLLAKNSEEGVCVCDITADFDLGQPTISHHLKILREAGLVIGEKRGKWVHYMLVPAKAEQLKAMLDRVLIMPLLVP